MFRRWFMLLAPLMVAGCGTLEWAEPQAAPTQRVTNSGSSGTPPSRVAASFTNADRVKVGRGDTLYAISRRHRVDLRELIEANNLRAPYVIQAGQWLRLPRARTHRVQAGQTLYAISRLHDVNPNELAALNRVTPPFLIRPGDVLTLPQEDRRPVAAAEGRPTPPTSVQARPLTAATPKAVSPPRQIAPRPTPAVATKGFTWPVRGPVIARFGAQKKGLWNDGINIAAKRGTPVRAAQAGRVAYVGNELRGFGNLVLIKHPGGWVSAYAHLDGPKVKRGQQVAKGAKIATVGTSGGVARPQLHFELRRGKRAVDPVPLLMTQTTSLVQ